MAFDHAVIQPQAVDQTRHLSSRERQRRPLILERSRSRKVGRRGGRDTTTTVWPRSCNRLA